ncbi:MAG: PilX N-terminal domain-containing pilus assembly protein [Azoarcus sp.]|nr:PilX N-terminal domain-containing pilus assembly protein [Azoarcus sp.]
MSAPIVYQRQAGAALIVALILLVVMTLLGLSSVRTVSQGERMTSNTFDRSLGFQGAEAALRAGEAVADAQSKTIPPNAGFDSSGLYVDVGATCEASPCQNGLCSQPDKDCTARWLDSGFNGWANAAGLGLTALAATPQYIVEYLGGNFPCNVDDPGIGAQNCKRYRVSARSHGGGDRAMVILQSIYATE